ncbi:hypothetical protein HZA41_02920 [Candidatus Peregrinibacteria bacterium]|nr:hypothetical protein [Candidatus Peregrinibacteria bacterium]
MPKQTLKGFDYFSYIDQIMRDLKLPENTPEENRQKIRALVEELVDDRIIQIVLSMFDKKKFDMMDEMMKKNSDMDESEALFIVADTIADLPLKLDRALDGLRDEFTHYGDLYPQVKKTAL